MKRIPFLLAAIVLGATTATAHAAGPLPEDDAPHAPAPAVAPARVPSADEARAAYAAFRADPLARLDRTEPFLRFIRDSGEVHMVLNNDLMAWMYQPFDDTLKAVLYASYLGGNMEAQLAHQDPLSSGDDVAGMASALEAYAAIQKAHADFKLPLFEDLKAAQAAHRLDAAVAAIVRPAGGTDAAK